MDLKLLSLNIVHAAQARHHEKESISHWEPLFPKGHGSASHGKNGSSA